MKRVMVDFETSGLVAGQNAPVTLGVAVMDGHDVLARQEWLFAPPMDKKGRVSRVYDVAALEISGASWVRIKKNGMPHADVCRELLAFSREHLLTFERVGAYNAPFDFSWYSDLLFLGGSWNQQTRSFQTFLPPFAGPWECARLRAVHALPNLENYTLDTVCAAFGLSRETDSHGALEDAILAGRVMAHLDDLAKAKGEAD